MSTLSSLAKMSRASNRAIETNLPKPATQKPEPAKTTTKKAAPAKKAEPKPGRSAYPADAVIAVKSTEHGKDGNGKEVLDCLKTGQTVEQFRAALAKKNRAGYFSWAMKFAIENKLITVKEAAK